jgi:RNA polymerase sigma-70 factor (ECF subfamily)
MTVKAPLPSEAPNAARVERSREREDRLAELGRAATAGDDAALERLLRAIAPDMLRVVRAVVGSTYADVEDLVQDCLLGFIRALAQFRYESRVTTFALTIAFRHALTAKRRQRDLARWIDTFQRLHEPLVDAPPSPAQDLEIERRRALVADLLTTIPKSQAEALGLRAVVGLSIEEIARTTDVPANTVRSRLRLAKESLRKSIEGNPDLREFLEPMG